jgi:hypothetical protein
VTTSTTGAIDWTPALVERWLRDWRSLESLAASGFELFARDGGRPGLGVTYVDVKADLEHAAATLDPASLGHLVVRERMRWPAQMVTIARQLHRNKGDVIAAHRQAKEQMARALGWPGDEGSSSK